jgi:site-specific DNA recombinase
VVPEEAEVVRRIFAWIAQERCSIGEVCRRLTRQRVPTRRGIRPWDPTTVWGMLSNPAYKGAAAYGKTSVGPGQPRLRPRRGQAEQPRRAGSSYAAAPGGLVTIPVPAIIDGATFAAIVEQLAENRERNRKSTAGARFLLQGLVVCKSCGYAFHGRMLRRRSRSGPVRAYGYYRCSGTDGHRFGGQRVCDAKQVRVDLLEAAVWDDIRALMSEPDRVRREYERRLEARSKDASPQSGQRDALIGRVRRGIARLIDAYEAGLLEKGEFEPRIRRSRERLGVLEEEARVESEREAEAAELRLVIGRLEEFAGRVSEGLEGASWETRRQIVRALVKKVEVDEEEVKIVYRIPPPPFDGGLPPSLMQDRGRRDSPSGGACTRRRRPT